MDLEGKTLEELKIIAYDIGRQLSIVRNNLNAVNQMIIKKENSPEKGKDEE